VVLLYLFMGFFMHLFTQPYAENHTYIKNRKRCPRIYAHRHQDADILNYQLYS
jgi:hypothetical protein